MDRETLIKRIATEQGYRPMNDWGRLVDLVASAVIDDMEANDGQVHSVRHTQSENGEIVVDEEWKNYIVCIEKWIEFKKRWR